MNKKAIILASVAVLVGLAFAFFLVRQPSSIPVASNEASPASDLSVGRQSLADTGNKWAFVTDPTVPWRERVERLAAMPSGEMHVADADLLLAMLSEHPTPEDSESWWVVANEIMKQIRVRGCAPDSFAPALLSIIRDPSADSVMRDYAVQHLGQWFAPRATAPGESDPALIADGLQLFSEVIRDPDLSNTSLPGTTLRVLADVQESGFEHPALIETITSLEPWIEGVVEGSTSASLVTRVSAINSVALFGLKDSLPQVRSLASSPDTDPSIKLNAIAVLGQLGDSSDVPALEAIAATDSRFQYAARTALEKLKP